MSPSFIFSCTTIASIFYLLLAAVHVKIKLGDNTLEYEENFSCKQETSDKKLANRSPYFTAFQYINNIETQTSPKTTFHRQE